MCFIDRDGQENTLPAEVSFPPAPWRMWGHAWAGLFHTDLPVLLPDGLQPMFGRRTLAVALVRYLRGPLRYDELLVGPPVRCGRAVGIWIDRIWVDSIPSLWGGRRIWGLPKELARFSWAGNSVQIADVEGPIATLEVRRGWSWLPPLPAALPAFGHLNGQWALFHARGWAWAGRSSLRVCNWSPRFAYTPLERPLVALAAQPFYTTIDGPIYVPTSKLSAP